ncbi:MAG: hypothetical protein KGZ57_11320 [Dethiobacter sp.]|nr:hypothetical protein [Dethiobacter sp.]
MNKRLQTDFIILVLLPVYPDIQPGAIFLEPLRKNVRQQGRMVLCLVGLPGPGR